MRESHFLSYGIPAIAGMYEFSVLGIFCNYDETMNRDDVETLERETLYQGWMRVERWRVRHPLFQGGMTAAFTREVLIRHAAAALLPFDPKTDRVCLIQQFRCGLLAAGAKSPLSTEMVAGLIDKNETPEAVARREANEEAGLNVKRIKDMGAGFTMPGSCDEEFFFFCGEVDLPDTESRVFGLPHEFENIKTLIVPRLAAIEMMDKGQIGNLPTLFALSWLARFGEALRKEWV